MYQPTQGRNTKTRILRMSSCLLAATLYLLPVPVSIAATLLPNGEQTFLDANGNPLAAGKVYFYIPGTTTPKTTYSDSGATTPNTNPVILDSAGRAILYGIGCYRQVVQNSASVTQWDQTTCDTASTEASWGGTASGTPNAISVIADNFSGADGQVIRFIAASSNTGAVTVNPVVAGVAFGAVSVVVDGGSGPIAMSGGEIIRNNIVTLIYDANSGVFHLSTLTTITAGAGLSTTGVGGSGGTIAVSGTLTSVQPINAQTGTTYTVAASDNAKMITFSNTSSVAVTLPAAAGSFAAGFWFDVVNLNLGVVTFTPASGTINGVASANLALNGHGRLVSDGTNWFMGGASGSTAAAAAYNNISLTVPTNSTTRVTADFLALRNTAGFSFAVTSVDVTCNLLVNGANGLDTGALANATWYYVWVISNSSTTACLGSTSATAPTMPSGYTFKKRVGAVTTASGASTLRNTIQKNDIAQYLISSGQSTPVIASGSAGTISLTTPTLASATVTGNGYCAPPTAGGIQVSGYVRYGGGAPGDVLAAPSTTWGYANSGPQGTANNIWAIYLNNSAITTVTAWITLDSSTIGYAGNAAGSAIGCLGWKDNL